MDTVIGQVVLIILFVCAGSFGFLANKAMTEWKNARMVKIFLPLAIMSTVALMVVGWFVWE